MADQVAVITGGAQGIGRATAERFVKDGITVLIADVDVEIAEQTAREVSTNQTAAHAVGLDVSQRRAWERAMARARELGAVWAIVNNAGILRDKSLRKMNDAQWQRVLDVHLTGTFLGCQLGLEAMVHQGQGGRIVNVASTAYLGAFGQANYSAAKGGVVSLTRTVALEGAKYRVTANAVAPGTVETTLFRTTPPDVIERLVEDIPLGRIGSPSELAAAIRFLASEDASYVTGQVLHVDGGATVGA